MTNTTNTTIKTTESATQELANILSQWNNTTRVYTRELTGHEILDLLAHFETTHRIVDGPDSRQVRWSHRLRLDGVYEVEVSLSDNISVSYGTQLSVYTPIASDRPLFGYTDLIV